MTAFNTDIFSQFDKKWGLLCAGTMEEHNAMTISWGGMGTLWRMPVVTVYVRPNRYTYGFMEKNEYFTVGFFPEEYRRIHNVMGSKSGRDMDKDKEAGVTPKDLGKAVGYEEAEVTFLSRKVYDQDMDPERMDQECLAAIYGEDKALHRMYIGEVVDIIRKEEK